MITIDSEGPQRPTINLVNADEVKRRVDVERLGLGRRGTTGGGIADVADAHLSRQVDHVLVVEHIAREAVFLAQMQSTFVAGHDPGGILPAVLQHQQGIIEFLVCVFVGDDACYATHG